MTRIHFQIQYFLLIMVVLAFFSTEKVTAQRYGTFSDAMEDIIDYSNVLEELDEKTKDKFWRFNNKVSLNISNVSLNNWSAGGNSNFSIGSKNKFNFTRESTKSQWVSQIGLQYGVNRRDYKSYRKTDDLASVLSKYGLKLNQRWSTTGMISFETQMSPGYKYSNNDKGEEVADKISNVLAPGYLLSVIGVQYQSKRDSTKRFGHSFIFAPFSIKSTFVIDTLLSNRGDYGVNPGSKERSEFGTNISWYMRKNIVKNIDVTNSLNLFTNYKHLRATDINWEMNFILTVNKYINANLHTYLIYDEDILIERDDGTKGPATQFKSSINIGFNVTF